MTRFAMDVRPKRNQAVSRRIKCNDASPDTDITFYARVTSSWALL